MLMGAGIQGGQVIGAMNESFQGEPVALSTGEVSGSGTALTPEHLGATLLTLADIDPAEYLPNTGALQALLR